MHTDPEATMVQVFYATDRKLTASPRPYEMYGTELGDLSYGVAMVRIPTSHERGELETFSLYRAFEDEDEHIVLRAVYPFQRHNFFSYLQSKLDKGRERQALVFIHGYQNTFEYAARRTAQMAFDLRFTGVPIFYSWPSRGEFAEYGTDEETLEWSTEYITTFLRELLTDIETDKIFLIAHSMGNRAALEALTTLFTENPQYADRFTEIILAAPDVNAMIFGERTLPKYSALEKRLTLYASSEDKALLASEVVNGYPRLGQSGSRLFVGNGVDTIDASDVDTGLIDHAYFGDSTSVIGDIFELIHFGKRPDERTSTLFPLGTFERRYWRFYTGD